MRNTNMNNECSTYIWFGGDGAAPFRRMRSKTTEKRTKNILSNRQKPIDYIVLLLLMKIQHALVHSNVPSSFARPTIPVHIYAHIHTPHVHIVHHRKSGAKWIVNSERCQKQQLVWEWDWVCESLICMLIIRLGGVGRLRVWGAQYVLLTHHHNLLSALHSHFTGFQVPKSTLIHACVFQLILRWNDTIDPSLLAYLRWSPSQSGIINRHFVTRALLFWWPLATDQSSSSSFDCRRHLISWFLSVFSCPQIIAIRSSSISIVVDTWLMVRWVYVCRVCNRRNHWNFPPSLFRFIVPKLLQIHRLPVHIKWNNNRKAVALMGYFSQPIHDILPYHFPLHNENGEISTRAMYSRRLSTYSVSATRTHTHSAAGSQQRCELWAEEKRLTRWVKARLSLE